MSEVLGKVHLIGQTEVVGSAVTFKKRLIVIKTDEQYSQLIPIDFVQDKCDILDSYKVGDDVKVSINIRGNEYNSKFYVSLNGWRISKSDNAPTPANTPTPPLIPTYTAQEWSTDNDPDNLPF